MTTLRCAIVDDEPLALGLLESYPNFNAPKKNQPFFDVFRLRNC